MWRSRRAALSLSSTRKGNGGRWLNNEVQLCAQALCLEEMLATHIPCGSIFYFGSAHREEVQFTEELRQHTEETVQRAFTLLERGELPPPLVGKQATSYFTTRTSSEVSEVQPGATLFARRSTWL